jgi:MFS family permease
MSSLPDSHGSQFRLLRLRRFAPFFWTQFLGAFNDNLFKNTLLLMITFGVAGEMSSQQISLMNNLAAGLFILPFLVFSAFAGQLADCMEKSTLIRGIKIAEIFIMIAGVAGFYLQSLPLLFLALFALGCHSAFFGPVKYSLIPQHLREGELVGGNALVESGTFLAILIGTLLAGVLSTSAQPVLFTTLVLLAAAVTGWRASCLIPEAPSVNPSLKASFAPGTDAIETIAFVRKDPTIFVCLLGISWFWFLGASYLTQLPAYTLQVLAADQSVVTLLLTLFSIGIAVGSLACEKLSGATLNLSLIPVGALGMTVFGLDVFLAHPTLHTAHDGLRDVWALLGTAEGYRTIIDYIGLGISGGLYIVPLYTLVQQLAAPEHRSRTIAAINIFNALFMIGSALLAAVALGVLGMPLPWFLLMLAVMNGMVGFLLCRAEPQFTQRLRHWWQNRR